MEEFGTGVSHKPPEMEGEVWAEYNQLNPWCSGARYEPFEEEWFISPSVFGPGSPFISSKTNPIGEDEV